MRLSGSAIGVVLWECYLPDPQVEADPSTWKTLIVRPIS